MADSILSAAIATPGPGAIIDTVPGDPSSTATLTVGAAPVISAIDTIADQDFYRIDLVAGHQYEIGMYGYLPLNVGDPVGPNGLPLLDSYLELYDAGGNLITAADGGSDTVLNTANSGFDGLLSFTATTTGTYYVNARAFDNIAADGTDGDLIGDYGLYAKDVTGDPSIYQPYYDPSSPLYAIDWGTQVDDTVRNPDGEETGHATGNDEVGTPDNKAGYAVEGKNVITVYFAQAGDIFVSNDLTNPGLPPATITATGVQDFERTAVLTALAEFAKVADVVYVEVDDRDEANFIYTSYIGTPGPGVSLLGSMSPPQESDEGLAQFNSGDYRWNATDLQQGGFSFVTLIHEFGHGHGLAHPHDNGGHSGIMNGVESEGAVADYTLGDYDLNQGVFTMMSYEDGWQTSPYGNAETDVGYGYLGGLMAFDIAAIQDKYGVNEDWATGNDTYVLKDENAAGTYYYSIWDAGGTDSIVYSGSRAANIDLRAASLQYEYGGGGWVSYAYGIYGGFTIANGVVIENATGGSGNDVLTGNDAANILNGGAGVDELHGGKGNDRYLVDNSGDKVFELDGEGVDTVESSASFSIAGQYVEVLRLTGSANVNATGNSLDNILLGNSGANLLDGRAGADDMRGGAGNDRYIVDNIGDRVVEATGEGTDRVDASVSFSLAGRDVETLALTGTAAINGSGNSLDNLLLGNSAANVLNGREGADEMRGGAGDDRYIVDNVGDKVLEAVNEGYDTVESSVSFSLGGRQVEALLLTGSAAINATGNGLANSLTGNSGANALSGGLGIDTLTGGRGADNFYFDAFGAANADNITDFSVADDTIVLDRHIFSGIAANGTLAAAAFWSGSAAHDADDRIVYDSATGNIWYDADGSGAAAAQLFAHVTAGTALTNADFLALI